MVQKVITGIAKWRVYNYNIYILSHKISELIITYQMSKAILMHHLTSYENTFS